MATEVMVFGNPITKSTVAAMPEHAARTTITRLDVAVAALHIVRASENKESREYVQDKLQKGEVGGGLVTLGFLNNFTGDALAYVVGKRWDNVGLVAPYSFPNAIENGQSVAFLTPKGPGEAVVFRGKKDAGGEFDVLLAWSNHRSDTGDLPVNKVYAEIHEPRVYDKDGDKYWDEVIKKVGDSENNGAQEVSGNGFKLTATISPGDISMVEATVWVDGLNVDE